MKLHRNCITDPVSKAWWRDYQRVMKDGNPLGLSFVDYIALRVASLGPRLTVTSSTNVPWYVSSCGHRHEWGESCSSLTVTQ